MLMNANLVISIKEEEVKKVVYTIQVRQKIFTLVKTWIDGLLVSEIALNSAGFNVTTPSTLQYLNEVIEQDK